MPNQIDNVKTELRRRLNDMSPEERDKTLKNMEGNPNLSDIVTEYRYPVMGGFTEESKTPATYVPIKAPPWLTTFTPKGPVTSWGAIASPEEYARRQTTQPQLQPPSRNVTMRAATGNELPLSTKGDIGRSLQKGFEATQFGPFLAEAGKTIGRTFQGKKPFGLFEIGKPAETPPPKSIAEVAGRTAAGFVGAGEPLSVYELQNQPGWMQALTALQTGAPVEAINLGLNQAMRMGAQGLKAEGRAALKTMGEETGALKIPDWMGKRSETILKKLPDEIDDTAFQSIKQRAVPMGLDIEAVKGITPDEYWFAVTFNKDAKSLADVAATLREPIQQTPLKRAITTGVGRIPRGTIVKTEANKVFIPFQDLASVKRFIDSGDLSGIAKTITLKGAPMTEAEIAAAKALPSKKVVPSVEPVPGKPPAVVTPERDELNRKFIADLQEIDARYASKNQFNSPEHGQAQKRLLNEYRKQKNATSEVVQSIPSSEAKVKPPVEAAEGAKPVVPLLRQGQPPTEIPATYKGPPTIRPAPTGREGPLALPEQTGIPPTRRYSGGTPEQLQGQYFAQDLSQIEPGGLDYGAMKPAPVQDLSNLKGLPKPAPEPPRQPVWAGKTEVTPTTEVATTGGEGVPPKLPSGRVPGGPTGPIPPRPDPYDQLIESLTPTKPSFKDSVTAAKDKLARGFYWRAYPLRELAQKSGIPVDDLFQIVSGMRGAGENNYRLYVKPVIDSLGRKLLPDLERYMVLMSEQDVMARNPQALLPGNVPGMAGTISALNTLKRKVGQANYARIEQAARQLWEVNDNLVLNQLKDTGFLDEAAYTRIKSANPHYIDFGREDFSLLNQADRRLSNPASVSSPGLDMRQIEGSTRKLKDPLGGFGAGIIQTPTLISRNEAAKAVGQALKAVQGAEDGPMFHLLKPGEAGENSAVKQTISWFENGQQVRAEVPAEFGVVAKNAEAEATNAFSRFFRTISSPLQAGATAYSPAFTVANPIWDVITARYRVKGFSALRKEYWQGWVAAITKNENFNDAARAGVYMSGLIDSARSIKEITRSAQRGVFTVNSWQDGLLLIPRLIKEAGVTGERATRTGGYLYLKNKGYTDLQAAIKGGRDITVDFSKSGTVMQLINTAIPFSNAGVQGLANVVRTARDEPLQAIRSMSPLAFLSAMVWVNNKRFASSDMIPDDLYYRNWPIQIGEYTEAPDPKNPDQVPQTKPIVLKIPKGPLAGPMLMPVETILHGAWKTGNKSVVEDMLATAKGMAQSASPFSPDISGLTPPLVGTAFQLATRQNLYTGSPIIPQKEERLLPEQQFGAETSKVAVALGQKFHVSPRLIDFAINDYTAGAGQTSSWLAGMGLQALGYQPEQYGAAFVQPATEIQKISAVPGISRYLSTRGSRLENMQWEELSKQVDATQRSLAANPEINRLGITFGMVGDSIGGKQLETKQRAEYQQLAGALADAAVASVTANGYYNAADDNAKKAFIQDALNQSRQIARMTIAAFEPKDNPTIEDYQKIAQTIRGRLQPYFDIENNVWGQYPPEVRQLSDIFDKRNAEDAEAAKKELYQLFLKNKAVVDAMTLAKDNIKRQKADFQRREEKLLKLYNKY